MNQIYLQNGKLVVNFRFDPAIVAVVRTIDGRIWNAKAKQWEIPIENMSDAILKLSPLGFTIHPKVLELQKQEEEDMRKITEIKTAVDWHYPGTLPLFDFQRKGAAFLKSMPSALLADVPGLGKSIQTLAATEEDEQVLIFCPASLKYSWEDEIKKWLPGAKVLVVSGNKQARTEAWLFATKGFFGSSGRPKYVIANYELLLHDFDLINDHEWPVVACDEATRISNPNAQTTKNLKLLKSAKRIALTGTPISNSPEDIYSLIDWIAPRYLGSYYHFRAKYCVIPEDDPFNRVTAYKNLDELAAKVDRFMLRRTKEEVFKDFPPKMVETISFDLSESERDLYQNIKEEVRDEIKKLGDLDTRTIGIIPVKMLRLKQCTGHTKLVGATKEESTKLSLMKNMLKEIVASGEKAIIFTQFSTMLSIMRSELEEFRPLVVWGGVDEKDRMVAVKEFNDDPKGRIIIMTEAGAYGLNMQSASYVFHYDSPWSIAKLMQREDRAHRIGRNKPVTVYNLVAKNTIDEYVLKVLHRKQKVSVDILADADRLEEAGLSKEDIDEILRL